ncbi:MAG: Rrf2 family transcriptional regulator [Candidatus Kapabacteria bacterium]|nr:Rrf2 family transcriptional regulator [Candidatus Kapabacteria bacterium]
MTALFSKRCELGLQAMLYLSTLEKDQVANAKEISEKLKIPKEFVSKVLQALAIKKIVGSKKGRFGGFFLLMASSEIRLLDIVIAIDGLEIFQKCALGFLNCEDGKPCPVHSSWGKLRDEVLEMLRVNTLESITDSTLKKIRNL